MKWVDFLNKSELVYSYLPNISAALYATEVVKQLIYIFNWNVSYLTAELLDDTELQGQTTGDRSNILMHFSFFSILSQSRNEIKDFGKNFCCQFSFSLEIQWYYVS